VPVASVLLSTVQHKHIQGNGKVEKEIRQWAVFKEAKVVRSKLWGAWKKGMLFGDKASCHFHTLRETVSGRKLPLTQKIRASYLFTIFGNK
jgi:hypothetical protein